MQTQTTPQHTHSNSVEWFNLLSYLRLAADDRGKARSPFICSYRRYKLTS